jgi:predicted HicB family RNase H-like nuclease
MVAVEAVTREQFTTRVPQSLHRELKLHCVTVGVSVMAFVTKAIEEKLARSPAAAKRTQA